jgi:hypothetical protein
MFSALFVGISSHSASYLPAGCHETNRYDIIAAYFHRGMILAYQMSEMA